MAGFSFNANRLFDEIRSKYNESFKFKLEIMQKKSKEPTPAFVFANLWPCSLSPYEAQNDGRMKPYGSCTERKMMLE